MSRKLASLTIFLVVFSSIRPADALALAGNLDRPSISIPSAKPGGKALPVGEGIYRALSAREADFTGGFFINAQSSLHFGGGSKAVNALLADLSKVDGSVVEVRLSKEAGVTRWFADPGGDRGNRPCDFSVEHAGWGDAEKVTITVYLGSKGIEASDLIIPPIRGR